MTSENQGETESVMTPLQKAQAARQAKLDAGEKIQILNPREKSEQNPASLRKAINAMCFYCMGDGHEPGWRTEIKNCSSRECPLHKLRPYQQRDDESEDEAA